MKKVCSGVLFFLLAIIVAAPASNASSLVDGDSRIQTLVYNENEIYGITTSVEMQSRIDFNPKEEIHTISLGDKVSWRIVPKRNSIFVKPIKRGKITNMMVITDKRSYQFELTSKKSKSSKIAYVTRFFYPEINMQPEQAPNMAAKFATGPGVMIPTNVATPKPMMFPKPPKPIVQPMPQPMAPPPAPKRNLDYTISGSRELAPIKIYDNGTDTFLEFSNDLTSTPKIAILSGNSEVPSIVRPGLGTNSYSVAGVYNQLTVRGNNELVVVFNEEMLRRTGTMAKSYKDLK